MKYTHKILLLFAGWLIASISCRYVWEYVDPWVGLILSVGVVVLFTSLLYRILTGRIQ